MMGSSTPILDVLSGHLPAAIASSLPSQSRSVLEHLLAFALGAECPPHLADTRQEWSRSQTDALKALQNYLGPTKLENTKRPRDSPDTDDSSSKRPKTTDDADDPPRFTLPSVSATSPVRKKVDVTVHARSIRLVNPNTRVLEYSAPLSSVTRAFMIPTRGKTKGHWTVVLLPVDAPDKAKTAPPSAPQQIIFGIDARSATAFEITSYSSNASSTPKATTTTVAKSQETAPFIRQLLSHLPVPLLQPSATVFRSACATPASGDGAAGVDAYLSAKSGTLWFLDAGILWGESKPCAFWAVEDLLTKDGVRLISATGRTCSVILSRKIPTPSSSPGSNAKNGGGGDDESEEEEEIVETEFAMVEGREQDPISAWARNRKHLFGKRAVANGSLSSAPSATVSKCQPVASGRTSLANNHIPTVGPTTIKGVTWDDSDPDDDDFEMASSEDLEHSSDSDSEASGGAGGLGSGADAEDDDSGVEEGSGSEGSEVEELDPAHHPLLRPGAMPRMSKAALDMVVDLVQGSPEDEPSEEEDELED